MAVLEEFMQRGVVVSPLHDGLLCGELRKEEAAEVMRGKAIEVAGAAVPVEETLALGCLIIVIIKRGRRRGKILSSPDAQGGS